MIYVVVCSGLLSCVRQCSERVQTTDKQDPIQKCFRVFDPLFKFVIQSRQLYSRATDGDSENDFRQDVFSLFSIFNQIASLTAENIVNTQVLLTFNINIFRLPSIQIWIAGGFARSHFPRGRAIEFRHVQSGSGQAAVIAH